MRKKLVFLLPLALFSTNCSSSSDVTDDRFDGDSSAEETDADGAISDSSVADTGAVTDSALDSSEKDAPADSASSEVSVDSGSVPDTASETGTDPGCGGVGSTATDVYVDAGATPPGKGGKACPFVKIVDALAAPLASGVKRVVWLAPGTYLETGFTVPDQITLRGAGVGLTTIKGAAVMCDATTKCTVTLAGGSAIERLTVNGTVPGEFCGVTIYSASEGVVSIREIDVPLAGCGGIVKVRTSANLTNVHIPYLLGVGLGTLTIRSESPGQSLFDGGGVEVQEYMTLDADGIVVRNAANWGVRIGTATTATIGPRKHVIKNSLITQNCTTPESGPRGAIEVSYTSGSPSLKLRNTKVLGNGCHGLSADASGDSGSVIDLGTLSDPGGNIFGSATPSERNKCSGVRLVNTGGSASLPARGNTWSLCPPPQSTISADCAAYSDIYYSGPAASPVDTTGCK